MARWARAEGVYWRSTLSGVMLLPAHGNAPVILSGSGAGLWELLDHPVATAEAAELLAGRYETSAAAVASVIEPIIAQLADLGAIEERP